MRTFRDVLKAVYFNFWNDTLGTHSSITKTYSTSNTNGWNGKTVEWVIENPWTGSAGTDMANFGGPVTMAGWGGMDSGSIEDWYTPNGNCLFSGGCESFVFVTPTVLDGHNNANGHLLVDSWDQTSGGTDYAFFQWHNYN